MGMNIIRVATVPFVLRCAHERKPDEGFLSKLSAPARRALEHNGITTLQQLATYREKEIIEISRTSVRPHSPN